MLKKFVSQYPVSKTLRFELVPIGKTLEHIKQNDLIKEDAELFESYKKMKKTIDEFHKFFIDESLSKINLTALENFYSLYNASTEEKSTKGYKDSYKKTKELLRKEVISCFANNDTFKMLNKKELIQKELDKWISINQPELYFDERFKNFTTYFKGYNENRMNMYSPDEKSTSIAYRLIDENLPKFIDNIQIFNKIKNSSAAENFTALCSDMGQWINGKELDDLFSLENYNNTVTQSQIDSYNRIIGGYSEGNTKIKGLNEYINLHNQQNPDEKLPKFKMLYKQILSDSNSISWIPEKFDNAAEMLFAVNQFCAAYSDEIKEKILTSLNELPECDLHSVYIRNNGAITDISNRMFGNYNLLNDALGIDPEDKKKKDYYSIAELQNALDEYMENMDFEDDSKYISAYSKDCILYHFINNVCQGGSELNEKIRNTYSAAQNLLNKECDNEYRLTQDEKYCLKSFLDSMMDMLHFIKPLYLEPNSELQKDNVFYSVFSPAFEEFQTLTKLYDKIRNFVTQKPYSTEKIKLNFDCSTLLDGWDVNKERQNLGVLLLRDGKYYLGIMDKKSNKIFEDAKPAEGADCYQKVMYKYFKDITTMIPKCTVTMKSVKAHFENDSIDYILTSNFEKPFKVSKEIFDLAMNTYNGKKKFQIDYLRQTGDEQGYADAVKKWISFCMDFLKAYSSTANYDYTTIYPLEKYTSISDFYTDVNKLLYKITYKSISAEYIDSLVNEGKLYLFQIYNKDFSPYAKGKPNLHTLYWKALFDEKNLKDVVYKLNGEAEVFYRKASIAERDKVIHKSNVPIEKKNPNLKGQTSTFDYDITKDRHYTVDKFQFHVPITMNFKSDGVKNFNESVCEYLKNNPDVNIIGIDRGERHLLYLSMIDRNGNVVKDKNGNYIQYSLNTITGKYKDSEGNAVKFETPYHKLLEEKEEERKKARESWGAIENIKELKSGYLSQVVYHIAKLMVDYNAIVVLEDLNGGFKNGRKKIEKQVYQNFEKALIDKLNYLVFKDVSEDEAGGLYNALQLTEKFESFRKLTKQSGFLFYIPAWNTSKIDPVTGFVDLLKPKTYMSMKEAKIFYNKFKSIRYNAQKDYFEFEFDYSDFTDKAQGSRTQWTVCTFGKLRYAYNKNCNNGKGGYERWDVTEKLKELFTSNGIKYHDNDLRDKITSQTQAGFFASLSKLLQVTLAMRYSSSEDGKDFILSPVADNNGVFYYSEGRNDGLPQDADANGAFNIARKGLWMLEQIDKAEGYKDWSTKISNKDWLSYVQTRFTKK